jgi:glycosyltransferase involved in cell wall biosynthesis
MKTTNLKEWSAIVTAFNSKNSITVAIDSVLNQTAQPKEILVVDDCSTDGTYELLTRLSERNPKLKIFRTERNTGGAAVPRNLALQNMRTGIAIIFDDDDVSEPNRAKTHLDAMQSGIAASYVGSRIYNPVSQKTEIAQSDFRIDGKVIQKVAAQLLVGRTEKNWKPVYVPSSVAAYDRTSILSVGGFDPNVLRREDIDLALKLCAANFTLIGIQDILVTREVTPGTDKSHSWDIQCEKRVFDIHQSKLSLRIRAAGFILYEVRLSMANRRSARGILLAPFLFILAPEIFLGSFKRWMSKNA